jgi:hypothetical protein
MSNKPDTLVAKNDALTRISATISALTLWTDASASRTDAGVIPGMT